MVSRAITQLQGTQVIILATTARLDEANLRQLEHMLAINHTTLSSR